MAFNGKVDHPVKGFVGERDSEKPGKSQYDLVLEIPPKAANTGP